MKLSLRKKLTLVFVVLIAVPMTVSGFISYYNSSNSLQSAIEHEMKTTAVDTADLINNELESVKNYITMASQNSLYADVLACRGENKELDKEAYMSLASIYKDSSVKLDSLALVDSSGKGVVDNEGISSKIDISSRDYFKTALSGIIAVSDVLTSQITGNTVITVSCPIKHDNSVIGELIATVKFGEISEYASKVKVGSSGYAYMIDKNGLFVYHPDSQKILKENADNTNNGELKSLIQKMKKSENGEGFYTYDGEKKFMAFAAAGNWSLAVTASYNEYMKPAFTIRSTTIILTSVFVIVAVIIAYLFSTKSVISPIKRLEKLMVLAGHGDLSVDADIKTGDELQVLAESFNKMLREQEQIVRKVRAGSDNLAAASEELASSSQEISAASEEIASSIQQVAAGSEEQNNSVVTASEVLVQLSSLVQLAQVKASDANKNADNTKTAAESGRNKIGEAEKAMNIINSSTDETANILKTVSSLSEKVRTIIDMINAIAGQTNLLALNAAIEAARAGEHGKGFTVVAEEVRKLAEQTNAGAGEISSLIGQMVCNIEKAVLSMDNAISAVNNGVVVVKDTDTALVSIIDAVDDIADEVKEIVDLTKDEVATSDQIIKLIDTIGTISETNSSNSENVASAAEEQTAGVENLAATAEEVSTMAEELESMVTRFKVRREE